MYLNAIKFMVIAKLLRGRKTQIPRALVCKEDLKNSKNHDCLL